MRLRIELDNQTKVSSWENSEDECTSIYNRYIKIYSNEKWPTQEISVRFGPFLSSYRVNIARCNLCARAKVKGYIKLKIEENTSVGKLVEPFQIW